MATMTAHVQGPMAACLQQLPGLPPPDLNLPALEPVKNREVYRVRPDDELEEVGCWSIPASNTGWSHQNKALCMMSVQVAQYSVLACILASLL